MPQLAISLWRWWARPAKTRPPVLEEGACDVSEEELLAAVLAETPNIERRAALRQLCGRDTLCRVICLVRRPPVAGVIRDISTTGIGLLMEKPVPPGTFLSVDVSRQNAEVEQPLTVRVVRFRRQENGQWLIGCSMLQPLSPDQVDDLI